MATAGEMSHLHSLQGTARERFARTLARREERKQPCQGCGKDFTSTRDRERYCSPECCVANSETNRKGVELQPSEQEKRRCDQCGIEFSAKRADARLCSSKCRKAQSRGNAEKRGQNHVTDNNWHCHAKNPVPPLHAALTPAGRASRSHPEGKETTA